MWLNSTIWKQIERPLVRKKHVSSVLFAMRTLTDPRKYFLSINEDKNVFKCWVCQESGGVLKLMSFLENKSEQEIIEQLRKNNGFSYQKHPVEKLTRSQLKMIGYEKIDWIKNREYDIKLYKHFRNHVYQKWLNFVAYKQDRAYQQLYIGLLSGSSSRP